MQLVNIPILEALKAACRCSGSAGCLAQGSGRRDLVIPTGHQGPICLSKFLGDHRVIFNIKGNSYRLVVKVRFQNGIVMIEWGGTRRVRQEELRPVSPMTLDTRRRT